jgi:diguanylate cyclase (GGDEF)-like protein
LVNNWGGVLSLGPFLPWAEFRSWVQGTVWRDTLAVAWLEAVLSLVTIAALRLVGVAGLALTVTIGQTMVLQLSRQRTILAQAQAIEAERRAARTDPLTQLPNRRALEEYAAQVTEAGLPAAIVIVDIDHFKRINDTWGHDAGDAVLKAVADRLAHACRTQRPPWPDRVGRWGGEEFVLLLPQMPAGDALRRVEMMRQAVQAPIALDGAAEPLQVTASAGGVLVQALPWDLTEAVKAADGALYRAKEGGRNQLCWADPAAMDGAPLESADKEGSHGQ